MDPLTTASTGFPPINLLGARGAILIPSVLAAWWFWRGRRRGHRLPVFLPIAVWGLATAGSSYRQLVALAYQGLADSTRVGYLEIRWSFWSLAFEALAGLTFLTLVLGWHRNSGETTTRRLRRTRRLLPILGVADVLLGLGLCLFFVAPDIPREITSFQATEDGLWIGTASFFDESALFYREHGAPVLPKALDDGPSRVDVLLATEGVLWSGGGKTLWRGSLAAPLSEDSWSRTPEPMVRSLVAHDGWLWAGGINPLVRRPLRDDPLPSPSTRVRTDVLAVGVLRQADVFQSLEETLWVGSREGLFRWQPGDGPQITRVLPEVRWIHDLVAIDDTLWIGNHQDLVRWRPGAQPESSEPPLVLPIGDRMFTLFHHQAEGPNSGGRLWIAGHRGLHYLDPTDASAEVISGGPPRVRVFHPALDGDLWLGGLEGLYRWRRESDRIERIAPELEWITALAETSDGLWIGTWRAGLHQLPSDAGPTTEPRRIDLGDLSHGWQRRDRLAMLALVWLALIGLGYLLMHRLGPGRREGAA